MPKLFFPKAFHLTLTKDEAHGPFREGLNEIQAGWHDFEEAMANHWWVKAHADDPDNPSIAVPPGLTPEEAADFREWRAQKMAAAGKDGIQRVVPGQGQAIAQVPATTGGGTQAPLQTVPITQTEDMPPPVEPPPVIAADPAVVPPPAAPPVDPTAVVAPPPPVDPAAVPPPPLTGAPVKPPGRK